MARSGFRAISHSVKKILRRNQGGVKCSKAKRKQLSRVTRKPKQSDKTRGKEELDADVRMEVEEEHKGKTARAEARKLLGKQLRQDQFAKRRGIKSTEGRAQSGFDEDDDDDDVDAAAGIAAKAAAASALATAAHNQRSYHKELARVLKESDVLLEVLDARDPLGCRCTPLENAVLQRMTSKRIVLVLNKVDLVPRENAQRWVSYLRQYFPTIPFKSSTQNQRHDLGRARGKAGGSDGFGAEAYGGEQLLQLLKNYSRSLNMKTAITVGIVGYPNVGKSSLINSLKRTRAVNVGATPGVTSSAQVVALDKKVKLMDCPGIVFARARTPEEEADVLLRNCVKVEKIDDLMVPIAGILRRCGVEELCEHFGIGPFNDSTEFLTLVAMKRGQLRKGGSADQEAAARVVLQDWNSGAIRYWSEPPQQKAAVSLVGQLADEFDWNTAPPRVVEDAQEGGEEEHGVSSDTHGPSSEQGHPMMQEENAVPAGDDKGHLVAAMREQEEKSAARTKRQAAKQVLRKKEQSAEEDEKYNFQLNRVIKKQQRTDRRKKRRALTRTIESLSGWA